MVELKQKWGTKRTEQERMLIGFMTISGMEYKNTGYCNALNYYQGAESIFHAEQIAKCTTKAKGEELINFIKKSNERMENEFNMC